MSICRVNDELDDLTSLIQEEAFTKEELNTLKKKKLAEEKKKGQIEEDLSHQKRLFILKFEGDIDASSGEELREQVNALLLACEKTDEVLMILDSGGGYFVPYGFAASQLERLRRAGLNLTIAVDYVAASGGYMMACVANQIIASPFAEIGSIGVYANLTNFHRLLKKMEVDYEEIASGAYKRTLTTFGDNTPEKRARFLEEVEMTHKVFSDFVVKQRPKLAIQTLATGETWYGEAALKLGLIDRIMTSDDYIVHKYKEGYAIFRIEYEHKKSFTEKLFSQFPLLIQKTLMSIQKKSRV